MHLSMAWRVATAALVVVALAGGSALAQNQNVTGEWSFTVTTDMGSGTPTLTFKQDGEAVTGTYAGQLGNANFKGTLKGNALEFSFTTEAQGQSVDVVYRGTVDGDAMKGTLAIAGGQLNGTFTGARKK
jgi:hypothetical protein